MDSQVDGLFKKMVQLLELMKQTGATLPSNGKISIELQKYERELYLNLRDYGQLLRRALQVDRAQAESSFERETNMMRMRNALHDEFDESLDWDAPLRSSRESREGTVEMPSVPPMTAPSPSTLAPPPSLAEAQASAARPIPPRPSAEEQRLGPRPRSASEILSQLHHPPPGEH